MLISIVMAIDMRLGAAIVFINVVVLMMSIFIYAIITLFQYEPSLYIGIDKADAKEKTKVVGTVKSVCFWTKSFILVLLASVVVIRTYW